MKVSYNQLSKLVDLSGISIDDISAKLTASGLEVEGVEAYESVKGGLEGVLIGEVVSCEPHPNADKLKITQVDLGREEHSQIVCGAPNVAVGQKVLVADVGSTLYPQDGEPFKIKKAKIRGEHSLGMICAEDELGLGVSHDGIMVLSTDLPNGTPASQHIAINNDQIIEIGLTPNRIDAASHLGVARELALLFDRKLTLPKPPAIKEGDGDCHIEVHNRAAAPRYAGVLLKNIKIAPSPKWLQDVLLALGQKPVNNAVDITNFVLHELGQPLHAFDWQMVKGEKIVVRTAKEGEKIVTLDEKDRTLRVTDLVICDEDKPLCIAGVLGGINSGVTDLTKTIFLESAYFSPDFVRQTAQHHQIKTDASFRFERGTDPNIPIYALAMAVEMMIDLCGAEVASHVADEYPEPIEDFEVKVRYERINLLCGVDIAKEEVKRILKGLEIEIDAETDVDFIAKVPAYRVDVNREVDIIEEVLRIYGYDQVPLSENLGTSYLANFAKVDKHQLRYALSQQLSAHGFFEITTNSLTKPLLSSAVGNINEGEDVIILNRLSEDLAVMRQSLIGSGLEVVTHNIKRRQENLKLYEFGKTYHHKQGAYEEHEVLALFLTGENRPENWKNKGELSKFHDIYLYVSKILDKFKLSNFDQEIVHDDLWDYGMLLKDQKGRLIAQLGKLNPTLAKKFDCKKEVFASEIYWEVLLDSRSEGFVYEEISKFPEVKRDLSLVLDKGVSYDQIKSLTQEVEKRLIKKINVFDVYEGDNIEEGKKAYALSYILQDRSKTLTDKVIDKTMNQLMKAYEEKLGAYIRK
ncbi:MAG: phenylalanine--tRNA ligase subunit beta [Cyclobacteriaceae bacterium]|nr:phenylalanine--tRNA ligase subunit beta [Cyclobacteriaceae bacterium]MCH8515637.1 phenylalanine--tRNA ligase subunit beta [Cyclobacteriaceae bacterium]